MKNILKLCFASVLLCLAGCKVQDNKEEPQYQYGPYAKGADLGWITEMEDKGYSFYDASGNEMECTALFKSLGFNSIRHRVWVNPTEKYCGKQDLIEKCSRVQNLGMNLMIDFHFSDWWADPQKQNKPELWKSYDVQGLCDAIEDHVKDVLGSLKDNGIDITWIQIGNEVTNGILWETCRVSGNNANNFILCFRAGAKAAKEIYPDAKIVLHIDNAWSLSTLKWFLDLMESYSLEYDVIGLSLYPSYWDDNIKGYPDWQQKTKQAVSNLSVLYQTYGKEVMMVEFGMPVSKPQESKDALQYILDKTKGLEWFSGIFLWEPESEPDKNNYSYGAFSNGKATIALDPFKE